MRTIKLLLVILFCSAVAHGQATQYQLNPPAPNAQVLICPSPDLGYPCPSPVTVYSDSALTLPVATPIQLGPSGFFTFYVTAGTYVIQLVGPGYGSTNRKLVTIGGGGGPATAVPFSGVTTGTNATALHMGTGGSLDATGSGTITATAAPFSGVSTGTNAVALHVGTGGTLDATGSGTIHATSSDALVGQLPISGVGSAGLSGTAPVSIASTGVISLTPNGVGSTQLAAQYSKWLSCDGKGLGDGLNAIAAGTYLQSTCKNISGVTVTITGVQCFTDNSGTSTLNAAGNTLGALLTGAITCTSSYAAGTQSANVLLTANDYIKFTFVADGTSKQTDWVVTGTY